MLTIQPITLRSGMQIYPFRSFDELIQQADGSNRILIAINAEKIIHATDSMRSLINQNIGYSDGAGAVKALQRYGMADATKLPGCELWLKVIEHYVPLHKSFYLVGAKQEVIETVVAKLQKEYPGIRIVGYRNGYLKDANDQAALADDIAAKRPDVVFVAMGSPKQEYLMESLRQRHAAWYQGLGGSFNVYAGYVKRAPQWWVNHNMEYAYRLMKEPSRIKRQMHLVKFYFQLRTGRI